MNKLTLSEALLEFKKRELKVVKDSKNSFYANSEYADINNVLKTIQPTLNDLGIILVQSVQIQDGFDVLQTNISMAHNPSEGLSSSVRLIMPQGKENMQTLGACVTYARRYGIISMLSMEAIGADADDDGNVAVGMKPKTPSQKRSAHVLKLKSDLDKAKKMGDQELATNVYEEAQGVDWMIPVIDYHARLFDNDITF